MRTANAADLSPRLLDAMITAGASTVIGEGDTGSKTATHYDVEYSGDTASGSTSFLNFGFGLEPVELIAGYRIGNVKNTNNNYTLAGNGAYSSTPKTGEADDVETKYKEMTIGVAFGF